VEFPAKRIVTGFSLFRPRLRGSQRGGKKAFFEAKDFRDNHLTSAGYFGLIKLLPPKNGHRRMTWLRPGNHESRRESAVFFEILFVRLSGFSFN
jgi:hypothetical protein